MERFGVNVAVGRLDVCLNSRDFKFLYLPSCNSTVRYGKAQILIGKSSINGNFHSYVKALQAKAQMVRRDSPSKSS